MVGHYNPTIPEQMVCYRAIDIWRLQGHTHGNRAGTNLMHLTYWVDGRNHWHKKCKQAHSYGYDDHCDCKVGVAPRWCDVHPTRTSKWFGRSSRFIVLSERRTSSPHVIEIGLSPFPPSLHKATTPNLNRLTTRSGNRLHLCGARTMALIISGPYVWD